MDEGNLPGLAVPERIDVLNPGGNPRDALIAKDGSYSLGGGTQWYGAGVAPLPYVIEPAWQQLRFPNDLAGAAAPRFNASALYAIAYILDFVPAPPGGPNAQ